MITHTERKTELHLHVCYKNDITNLLKCGRVIKEYTVHTFRKKSYRTMPIINKNVISVIEKLYYTLKSLKRELLGLDLSTRT